MTHWAERYIGLPWANHAQGPDAFDCWGFVRHVYAVERGIDLPLLDIDADQPLAVRHAIRDEKAASRWIPTHRDNLVDFDVVLLSQARHPDHIGVSVEGAVLHCVRGAGVVFQSFPSLAIGGWNVVACYRWGGA